MSDQTAPSPDALADDKITSRLTILMGPSGVERIRAARVAVFGCGGVGSSCVEALARGYVGTLAIVDGDAVEASNINRQALAFQSTVGRRKVEVMSAMVADINPAARVLAYDRFVLPDTLDPLMDDILAAMGGIDYIVDALDTVATKLALAAYTDRTGIPLVSSMGAAMKVHPERLRIADISETRNCALSRTMRKACRKRGIAHLTVLFSDEEPLRPAVAAPDGARLPLGTASFMPPIMGQMIAGHVIRELTGLGADAGQGRARKAGR